MKLRDHKLRDLAELVRAPAALSVPGDAIAGATAAGRVDARTAGLAAASVCLYLAGMAGNDWADRELDAVERPERPIPSGRVSADTAFTVAAGLSAAGICLAAASGGRRTLAVAAPLTAAIWAYNVKAKNTAAGPAAMALCRGLDVLMGASTGRMRRAIVPAAIIAGHTYTITELSRHEVHAATRALPAATMAATGAVAAAVSATGPAGRPHSWPAAAVGTALTGWYATSFGAAQRQALRKPIAGNIRAAVGAGIMALPTLQGSLIARYGRPLLGMAVALSAAAGKRLAKHVARQLAERVT